MAEDFKSRLGKLGDRLKTEPATIPMQQVNPVVVTTTIQKEENIDPIEQFNVKIPSSLAKKIKVEAAKQDRNIKELVADVLEKHFSGNE